ncbi:hypothetical protein Emag_002174 [Eimeria magna]
MEEVAAAASPPDIEAPCGAPEPQPNNCESLRLAASWGVRAEVEVSSRGSLTCSDTQSALTTSAASLAPEVDGSIPGGLLPLMAAAGIVDEAETEQEKAASAAEATGAAAAEAAAAEGAPRLLECFFGPNPAKQLAAANADDLELLKGQDMHALLLRHAIRAEHDDRGTLQLLELLMLQQQTQQQLQQEAASDSNATVKEQLVDQLLLPRQQHEQPFPVECLCGLPVEAGRFSCSSSSNNSSSSDSSSSNNSSSSDSSSSSSTSGAAAAASGGWACCKVTPACSLPAVSQALFCCCCQGKLRCFLLLERCCSIKAANNLLLQQGRGSLMHAAAMGGSRAIIRRLATAHGLSPRGAPDSANYNEPIHLAACCGRTSAVLLLLELGVPIEAPDRFRRTPAFHAAANGHVLLLRALAAMGANLNVQDADGLSPLQEATARRRIRDGRAREEVVSFLLENNAGNRPKRTRD